MIAFVTGSTGYLGRWVVRRLASEGATVRCLIRQSSSIRELQDFVGPDLWGMVEVVRGELLKPESYRSALQGVDVVHHLAAGKTGGAPALFLSTVVPARSFVTACCEMGVPRFVLVSSLGIYGAGALKSGSTLDETCPPEPQPQRRDAYSFSKVIQEQVCREIAIAHGLPFVILRPGVIIGQGPGAMTTRIGLSLAGLTCRIGGARELPYTYVENCAAAICLAGRQTGVRDEAINILDDDLPTVRGVLAAYRRLGRKKRTVWLPQFAIGPLSSVYEWYHRYSEGQLPGIITRYQTDAFWKPLRFSNRKAKDLLSWTPHVPMAQALERSILGTEPRAA